MSASFLAGLHVGSPAPETGTTLIRQMAEGWREFSSRSWLWVMVLQWALLLLIAEAPLDVLGPVVARSDLGGAGAWGLIESGFAAGMLVGRVVAMRFPSRYPLRASAVGLLFASFGYAALAIPASVIWIVAMRAVSGIAFTFYGTLWTTTLQQRVRPERLARVSSFEWFGSMALTPVGYALAGPASGSIGTTSVLWIGAAWVFFSAVLLLMLPSVRNLTSDDTDHSSTQGI